MKYKVIYKARRKNAARHIAWRGTLEDCKRSAANINAKLYIVTVEDFKGNVIE